MRAWTPSLLAIAACVPLIVEQADDDTADDDTADAADDDADDDDADDDDADDDDADDDDAVADADGDGHPASTDCDDDDPLVGAPTAETCNALDDDCDGVVDDLPPAPALPETLFAAIGDYGNGSLNEGAVSTLVKGWNPEFILTLGDNNYPDGEALTIDLNIGLFYADFIAPYRGFLGGAGGTTNRFWPCPGNHDWNTDTLDAYLDYFTLPGNERYYDVVQGPVHLFAIDSDGHEPDGISSVSVQAQWLQGALAASTAPWKIVYFHHPAWTSATGGQSEVMRWPFADWGASIVLAGHEHNYERLQVGDLHVITNGSGGADLRELGPFVPESRVQFEERYGAQRVVATDGWITFDMIDTGAALIDRLTLRAGAEASATVPLVAPGATWRYRDDGVDPGATWAAPDYDDAAWAQGPAPLGYGGGQATTVSYGANDDWKHLTTWFRTTFEVDSACAVQHLLLRLQRDDGAVVYLNGVEVYRSNIASGALGPNTNAAYRVRGSGTTAWLESWLDPAALVAGTNVLAVEVRQHSRSSGDLRLDLELRAQLAP